MSATQGDRDLAANYRYLLHWMERTALHNPEARMLDYGCGRAEVVAEGRARGLAVFGAEVFYEGNNRRTDVEARGLLGDVVREIKDGRLGFDDEFFDLVVANQVFEHVDNFEPVLDEILRVLKPGGRFLALFPSKGVLREGHIGIPIVHWLVPGQFRWQYARALRRAGLGYQKGRKTSEQWTTDALDYLDKYTFYRPKADAIEPFQRRFRIRLVEDDYARFRLKGSARLAPLVAPLHLSVVRVTAKIAIRRLAGMVILAEKLPNQFTPRRGGWVE